VSIFASYESRCGVCDGLIIEGDEIQQLEDEWVHEQCAVEMLSEEDNFEVTFEEDEP
jgi:hypothetical protein